MPVPPGSYDHIRWRRLPDTAHRRTRPNPVGNRFPLRPNPTQHGGNLNTQVNAAVNVGEASRRTLNIDPQRLVVLELDFLESGQREHLGRLQIEVVDEAEIRTPLATPHFDLPVKFQNAAGLNAFLNRQDLAQLGVTSTERQRASSGQIDQTRLTLQFEDRALANQFRGNQQLATTSAFEFKAPAPITKNYRLGYRLLAQFPNADSLTSFRQELTNYQNNVTAAGNLTDNQRRELFDALDEIKSLQPADRTGLRLQALGQIPDGVDHYFDVDLWHPGTAHLAEAIRQFDQIVNANGGAVTDRPTSIAEALLVARVRGQRPLLNALLNYDRVSLVDLPPKRDAQDFGILTPITIPGALPAIPDDGPLACVVDSGVVSGHPLLRGVIVDERDFDSGENTPTDMVGHGTHMAGVMVYGDVAQAIRSNSWIPKVRLLSAKVMRLSPTGGAEFANDKRVETQVREAITTFATEYGCRVFNLSFGHEARPYKGGRQLPWAQMLDELSRTLNIVCVVSAGNVSDPAVPTANTQEAFQAAVRDQVFDQSLIDPATSMLSLTVGAVAQNDIGRAVGDREGQRPPIVASPMLCPSPFTRCGILASDGPGPRRAVKPDLVGFGGNYALQGFGGQWTKNDPFLGVPSLRFNFQGEGRVLSAQSGTSPASAYASHCAAIVESELRRGLGPDIVPHANLIRCLVVHGARNNEALVNWVNAGHSDSDGEARVLKSAGYGLPDPERASFSTDHRVTLFSQDRVQEDYFHLYELELPDEFITRRGRRGIRVSLAYDPPVRGTRKEYLGRTMWFKVYRGLTSDAIVGAMSRAAGSGALPSLPSANEFKPRPPYTSLQWSTAQSALFEGRQQRSFDYRNTDASPAVIHVLVGCQSRFSSDPINLHQDYALALSLEHSDETIRLHQTVRQRVSQRIRAQWPNG